MNKAQETESGGLHLLYKNLGETPLECMERFRKNNPEYKDETMTYAGRLDPMAEGLLIVLSGKNTKEKEKHLNLPKTYIFEILWGFETDSLDILGKVSGENDFTPEVEDIQNTIKKSIGRFIQRYPAYSSKPFMGMPLAWYTRLRGMVTFKLESALPSHEVEIFSINYISRRMIGEKQLLNEIIHKVDLVNGDFRQKEIKNEWIKNLKDQRQFIIDKIEVRVSRGFYIRQFISDLSKELRTVATTFHIKRTKIGDFFVEN